MKSISTLMYMVWHVDKYKIRFKLIISPWTNEMSFSTHSWILFSSEYFPYKIFIHEKCLENQNDNFQENLLRPSIIDARARYRAAVQWLRNTDLCLLHLAYQVSGICHSHIPKMKTEYSGSYCSHE